MSSTIKTSMAVKPVAMVTHPTSAEGALMTSGSDSGGASRAGSSPRTGAESRTETGAGTDIE